MRDGPELRVRHTHLYPSARIRIEDPETAAGAGLRLSFSDLAHASGQLLAREGLAWLIAVGPYRTAAGTAIPAKHWRLEPLPGEPGVYRARKT